MTYDTRNFIIRYPFFFYELDKSFGEIDLPPWEYTRVDSFFTDGISTDVESTKTVYS